METSSSSASSSSMLLISNDSENEPDNDHTLLRTENFDELTVPKFDDQQFREYSRISRSTMQTILLEMSNSKVMPTYAPDKANISNEKALLMTYLPI